MTPDEHDDLFGRPDDLPDPEVRWTRMVVRGNLADPSRVLAFYEDHGVLYCHEFHVHHLHGED